MCGITIRIRSPIDGTPHGLKTNRFDWMIFIGLWTMKESSLSNFACCVPLIIIQYPTTAHSKRSPIIWINAIHPLAVRLRMYPSLVKLYSIQCT